MTREDCDLYVELAELVRSNVSGPMKKKMVADAQRKLIEKMQRNGVVSDEEADALSI